MRIIRTALMAEATKSNVTGSQLVEKFQGARLGQVFIELCLIELEHRRRAARREALDRRQREFAVGSGLANADVQLAADAIDDFAGAAETARKIGAYVEQVAADGLAMEHRIE